MSEVKHTPGPWKAWQPRGDESVPVRTDGLGVTIAYVHQGAITNAQANARLIAAAPELLAALKSAAESIEQLVSIGRIPANNKGLRDARAAIAKAEGRS